jgi:hypothetical protein
MYPYDVGCQFKFKAVEPNSLTEELGSVEFGVEVTQVLRVGQLRRSQVVFPYNMSPNASILSLHLTLTQ